MNSELSRSNISGKEIFTKIWTAPRAVFRFIDFNNYEKHLTILLMLSGIVRTFNNASIKNLGDNFSIWGVIGFSVVLGALFGWITYYIYAALVGWTGKWIGGIATTRAILRILAYAMFPSIVALILLIPQMLIYGNELFKSDGDVYSENIFVNLLFYFSLLLEFALSFWTIFLCVIGVSEVQKFSIGRAILNLLMPAFLFAGIILILFSVYRLAS